MTAALTLSLLLGAGPAPTAATVLGDATREILEGATQVVVYHLAPQDEYGEPDPADAKKPQIDGFVILGAPITVDVKALRPVLDTLRDDHTWSDPTAYFCTFSPSLALRVTRKDRSTDVLLCLDCSQARFVNDGKTSASSWFKAGRPQLIKALKKALPKDQRLRALPDGIRWAGRSSARSGHPRRACCAR